MKKFLNVLSVLLLFLPTSIVFSQDEKSDKTMISVGDEAPDWIMMGSDGKEYKLSSFRGKKAVVVAWYPMALTGG